jgi:hypothetical protein
MLTVRSFRLSPVLVSSSQDVAVYVEPNVWIEHRKP